MAKHEEANPQVAMLEPQGPSAKQIAKEVAKLVGIKSIQRGAITLNNGIITRPATITEVVLAKAVLHFLGARGADSESDIAATLTFTNSTTITALRSTSTGQTVVSYEVVEYN